MAYEAEFLRRALQRRVKNLSRAWGLDPLDQRPMNAVGRPGAADFRTGRFQAGSQATLESNLANLTT